MRVMITGGCGFVGHHMVEHFLKHTDWTICILDKLSYASSGLDRLRDIKVFDDRRLSIFTTDFTQALGDGVLRELSDIEYIFHLGAETHVDRSIDEPGSFITANVIGTYHMLNFARQLKNLKKFFYFSTDEVFGPAPPGVAYKEWDRYNSGNPYAAAKAGGEELCLAFGNTYKLPIVITHCMNIFGERQHSEKFIPKVIKKVLANEKVLIHADASRTVPGSRYWIHARNVAAAISFLLDSSQTQDKYNIVGEKEVNNLEIAKFIASVVGKPLNYELVDFHSSRPGHDLRYALDGEKMHKMGWRLPVNFEDSLEKTVRWLLENPKWLAET